ncbi:ArsA-related P-loop ATPase [Branchiibius cervicis]|uniref:ArsA-related P-loop ATPase n=1 Tax=Branchiibius cervicis TaxID=908252 RepID=A0ABW2APJ3_9MICO
MTGRWEQRRLHIVTGKGGTGKTTAAAALATALARQGKTVLIAEVEGRQGISQAFDVPPLSTDETPVARGLDGGSITGLSVDAKAALLEYLQMFYKLGRAGGMLEHFGVVDFATTIAPGVRDVLLIGKVYEAVRRRDERRGHKGEYPYDAVVLDAPPTGRIGKFLNVNAEFAGLARMGPLHNQADSIMQLLHSSQTAVHIVTLLEEMPVQETVEAVEELRALNLPVGELLINQVREPLLSDRARSMVRSAAAGGRARTRDLIAEDLRAAKVRVSPAVVDGLLDTAVNVDQRLALQDAEREDLAGLALPTSELPAIPGGVDAGALRELADVLHDSGAV